MKRVILAYLLACSAGLSAPAVAQSAARAGESGSTITVRGLISGTLFLQDQTFGFSNGQNAAWAALPEFTEDKWIFGGDVRNTRITLGLSGPEIVAEWRVGGTMEMDFFGGFVNAGPFGDEQPSPRLRLAYADLSRRGTTLRIGQAWAPLFGYVPVSVSHVAFPLGWGSAGGIGWRFPGIFLYQNLTRADAGMRAQLQLAAMRGSWTAAPGLVTDNLSPGEASTVPQLEARLDLSSRPEAGTPWGAYLVAHYDRKDLSGAGASFPAPEEDRLDAAAVALGARVAPGPLTLHGSAYLASGIGQQLAHITQFGDISGWGAWGQVGYELRPRWSVWGFYGISNPQDGDVREALLGPLSPDVNRRDARLLNQQISAMLRFSSGPYSLGIEWLQADTDWASRRRTESGEEMIEDTHRIANQFSFSVLLSF